jgi:hypothetical protein
MGSSSSKSNVANTNDQTYISKNTVEILNKTTNEAVANALIKSNSSCSTVNTIDQLISFSGCQIGGDLNISNVKQDAMITVDFSCVNVFKAEQEMAQALMSQLVSQLQSEMDAKSLNDMNTKAQTGASTSGILSGNSKADSNVTNTYNLKVVNENNTAMQNVVANSVQANFEVESIQKCMAQAAIQQTQDYSNCKVAGNVNVSELTQNSGISSVVKCVNQSGTVQSVMNQAANDMNIVVKSDTSVVSESVIANTIKTTAESVGLGGGCPSCPCPGCGSPSGSCIYLIVICVFICLFCCFLKFSGWI